MEFKSIITCAVPAFINVFFFLKGSCFSIKYILNQVKM